MNNCIFIGRTTKDVELRYSRDGKAVGNFALAVDRGYGDSKKTEFLNFTAFGKQAEALERHVRKGCKIAIRSEAAQNDYEDRNGVKHYSVNFIVNAWEFMESKSSNENREQHATEQSTVQSTVQSTKPTGYPAQYQMFPMDDDDDFPL